MNDEFSKTDNATVDNIIVDVQSAYNAQNDTFPIEDATIIKNNVNSKAFEGDEKQSNDEDNLTEEEKAKRADAEAKEKAKREEIQKYIDSLADKDVYDPNSYEVHLENFDGPLDLLWFLIRRSKIDISEIFVS